MPELPEIKVREVEDVTYSNIELHVPDEVYDKIVNVGKEEATDANYFQIGFMAILEENFAKDDEGAE
jgi:hypothetical protein